MGHIYQDENNGYTQQMRHRKHHNHRRLMFWAAEQRSKEMRKITVKLKTGTSQEEAEMLISVSGSAFPEADIDVIYCDDPALSVVLVEKQECTNIQPPASQDQSIRKEFNPHARSDGGNYGRD